MNASQQVSNFYGLGIKTYYIKRRGVCGCISIKKNARKNMYTYMIDNTPRPAISAFSHIGIEDVVC